MAVLTQVCTLFLLMLCGLAAARFRVIDDKGIAGLNTLVLCFAQPALIIAKLQMDVSPRLLADLGLIFVLTCIIMALCGLAAWRLFRRQAHEQRSSLANLAMASNCGFMGYPVIIAAFGEDALVYAVLYVTGFQLMCWTLGAYFFGGRKAVNPLRILRTPSICGIAIGLVLLLTGLRLPSFVNDALDMIGATTTPLAMFIVGTRLLGLRKEHLLDKPLLLTCALRLLIFPALILLLRLTPLPDVVVSTLYLCTAMPCATLSAMQADIYHCDSALASRGVALSTSLSMATVPLMLMLL